MSTKPAQEGQASAVAGTLKEATGLVERLSKATRNDFDALKREAAELCQQLDTLRRSVREVRKGGRGRDRERLRAVDEWILDIFRSTESAVPRATLLDEFVTRYRSERRVFDSSEHGGPWLFAFEMSADDDGLAAVRPMLSAGVHPQAFKAACDAHLQQADADPFFSTVMFETNDIHGWHSAWFEGSPLFDQLLNVKQRFGGESDYWVSAIALQGDERNEPMGLFVLHANAGDVLSPEPPSTLRQDLRVLLALSSAWRQLGHQVKTLAVLTEKDRRELLNLIAPGLMHHEVGTTLRTLYGQAYELFHLLKHTHAGAQADAQAQAALRYGHSIGNLALRAHNITHVFNNLDKRGQLLTTDLHQVMSDVLTLLHHRLGAAATELKWQESDLKAVKTRTDVVLLQQAIINIIINAINALVEAKTLGPRCIVVRLEPDEPGYLALSLSNNGPAIEPALVKDIFRRGFTTRVDGHGQGLYLVRLIAHYLRGHIELLPAPALPQGCTVGFHLCWVGELNALEGLARATPE